MRERQQQQAREVVVPDLPRDQPSTTFRDRVTSFWHNWLRPLFVTATWRLLRWDDPERGDVVVLVSPVDGRPLLKRVIGLPGDRVAVRRGQTFIDGAWVSYELLERSRREELDRYGFDATGHPWPRAGQASPVAASSTPPVPHAGPDFGPAVVPAGHYFLMGDHRDDSIDSRFWGFASRERIMGRAAGVTLSVDLAPYRPGWSRFFTALP